MMTMMICIIYSYGQSLLRRLSILKVPSHSNNGMLRHMTIHIQLVVQESAIHDLIQEGEFE